MSVATGMNGKTGDLVRWAIALGLSALISYFTAMGAIEQRVTAVETRQGAQFDEVQRSLSDLKAQQTEMRSDIKQLIGRQR